MLPFRLWRMLSISWLFSWFVNNHFSLQKTNEIDICCLENRSLDIRIRMYTSHYLGNQGLVGQLHGYVLSIFFKGEGVRGVNIILVATFRLGDGRGCGSIVSKLWPHRPLFINIRKNSLVSYLPPSTTIRKYHRNLLSTTSAQLGTVYCAILSFAYTKSEPEIEDIIICLLAVRAKLNHSIVLRTNISYEV